MNQHKLVYGNHEPMSQSQLEFKLGKTLYYPKQFKNHCLTTKNNLGVATKVT